MGISISVPIAIPPTTFRCMRYHAEHEYKAANLKDAWPQKTINRYHKYFSIIQEVIAIPELWSYVRVYGFATMNVNFGIRRGTSKFA